MSLLNWLRGPVARCESEDNCQQEAALRCHVCQRALCVSHYTEPFGGCFNCAVIDELHKAAERRERDEEANREMVRKFERGEFGT